MATRAAAVLVVLALAGCAHAADRQEHRSLTTAARSVAVTPALGRGDVTRPVRPLRPLTHAPTVSVPVTQIDHGPRARREVALTFDADMTEAMLARLRSGTQRSWYDAAIVRELRATRTPATIFLTGLWTSAYPAVVRSLASDPLFELENHSVDHAAWTASCYGLPAVSGASSKRAEVADAAATIRHVAGVTPRYFRFPGGCHGAGDLRLVAATGERAVAWDVISGDPFQPDRATVEHDVLSAVRPGSIVVMHLIGAPNAPATATALPTIIAALKQRGLRPVTLRRLVREPTGAVGSRGSTDALRRSILPPGT